MIAENDLENMLSEPSQALIDMMARLKGDIVILGIAGKMGVSLGHMAVRAVSASRVKRKITGVSRFSSEGDREALDSYGVETVQADLMNQSSVNDLPDAENILYMVGRKFGTAGSEPLTWAVNTLLPTMICRRYAKSNIVAFSTGCVYPLEEVSGSGSSELTPPGPIGEYAQACLGRERLFQYFSETNRTPMLLYRLNYAAELRYGVIHDIARWIHDNKPVPLNVPVFNCIWQRDANERALLSLEHCKTPSAVLNISGPEKLDVRQVAEQLAMKMKKSVTFSGSPGSRAYLCDVSASVKLFGAPSMPVSRMIDEVAGWVSGGGRSLDKPTHFEVSNGVY